MKRLEARIQRLEAIEQQKGRAMPTVKRTVDGVDVVTMTELCRRLGLKLTRKQVESMTGIEPFCLGATTAILWKEDDIANIAIGIKKHLDRVVLNFALEEGYRRMEADPVIKERVVRLRGTKEITGDMSDRIASQIVGLETSLAATYAAP